MPIEYTAAWVYGICTIVLFGISSIYHSYPNKKDKEYLVIEYDREGKEKYRSVYQEKSKEMIIYNYGIITERRKEIAGGKESITKYDKTGNITTTTEEYISYGVQDYDESEY